MKNEMRMMVSCFMLLISISVAALPWDTRGVRTAIGEKTSVDSKVTYQKTVTLFQWLNYANKNHAVLTKKSLNHYFSRHIQYRINGALAANGINALYKRCLNMFKAIRNYHVIFPLNSVVVSDKLAAVTYRLNTVLSNGKVEDNMITVIMRFHHGKVSRWDAVIEKCD